VRATGGIAAALHWMLDRLSGKNEDFLSTDVCQTAITGLFCQLDYYEITQVNRVKIKKNHES